VDCLLLKKTVGGFTAFSGESWSDRDSLLRESWMLTLPRPGIVDEGGTDGANENDGADDDGSMETVWEGSLLDSGCDELCREEAPKEETAEDIRIIRSWLRPGCAIADSGKGPKIEEDAEAIVSARVSDTSTLDRLCTV